jgi:hypothetical protein
VKNGPVAKRETCSARCAVRKSGAHRRTGRGAGTDHRPSSSSSSTIMRTFPPPSDNDSPGDDYVERTPPPRQQPPPRPPPPPPPPPRPWVLQVQLPWLSSSGHHHPRDDEGTTSCRNSLRQIQIDGSIFTTHNVDGFARYLQHGLSLDHPPAGLFAGDTGVFVSLQHILKLRDVRQQNIIYSVDPPRPPPPPELPWYQMLLMQIDLAYLTKYLLLPLAIAYYVFRHLEATILWTGVLTMSLGRFIVDQVDVILSGLYHQGPWYLGFWEGDSLPSICARITYHGDAGFWYRNLSDCQIIFDTKRTAWLHIARPITYGALLMVTVVVLILLVRECHRPPPPVNPDMVDLYRAFHTIAGQFQQGQRQQPPPPRPAARGGRGPEQWR